MTPEQRVDSFLAKYPQHEKYRAWLEQHERTHDLWQEKLLGKKRDDELFNEAADYVINELLRR